MFFKIYALKNFAIFTGKHLCWSLFWSFGLAFNELIKLLCWGTLFCMYSQKTKFFKKKKNKTKEKTGVVFRHRMKLVSSFLTKKKQPLLFSWLFG